MRISHGLAKRAFGALAAVCLAVALQACSATTGTSSPIAMGPAVAAPLGVQVYCRVGDYACGPDLTINLTNDLADPATAAPSGGGEKRLTPPAALVESGVQEPALPSLDFIVRALAGTQANLPPYDVSLRTEVSAELLPVISQVNREINGRLRWRADIDIYGVMDRWAMPLTEGTGRFGDCEDFALEKRARLIAMGIPEGALAIALTHSQATGSHAVLVVRTDAGDYVLDNTTPWVLPWRETAYRWIDIQDGPSLLSWRRVDQAGL